MQKEIKAIFENHVREVGFSELLIAIGLVFILGVISTATSVMSALQVKRQALKLDKQEAFYTGELAAWHFYYKNDGASQPCSISANHGDKCIVSITNETIQNAGQTGGNTSGQNQYYPESYQPGMPLALTITSLYDSKNTILRRYTGDNVKIKNLARTDIVSFCGEMSFATRTRTFSICLVGPPEAPPYPPPPTGDKTGKMTVDMFPAWNSEMPYAVALQSDGKIVVAGNSYPNYWTYFDSKFEVFRSSPPRTNFALARFLPNGQLDVAFGKEGRVLTSFGNWSFQDESRAVAIQSDGKIVAAGVVETRTSSGGSMFSFGLARYQSNGALDTSFGGSGRVVTIFEVSNIEIPSMIYALKILANGKIIAAGTVQGKIALARYNTDGTLDSSFGSGGKVVYELAGTGTTINALGVQQDGKIVVGGGNFDGQQSFAVARFSPDGSIDGSFGSSGSVRTLFYLSDGNNTPAEAFALVIQPDGKIVLAGGGYDVALARYNTDGTLDTTFGNNGKLLTDFMADPSKTERAMAVAIGTGGRIIIGGFKGSGGGDFGGPLMAAYSPNGALENTFPFPAGLAGHINTMAIQPDSKIVGAGTYIMAAGVVDGPDFSVVRYLDSGVIDPGFGLSNGQTTMSFLFNDDHAFATTIQPDGKILVAGTVLGRITPDFGLARLNSDGSLDSTFGSEGTVTPNITVFGSGGIVTTNLTVTTNIAGLSTYDYINGIALQSDGKIVVAGNTGGRGALVRYESNGNLDLSFGAGNGYFVFSSTSNIFSIAIQPDDKIVVAGSYGDVQRFMLARFNVNGSLDGSFGTGGIVENSTYQTYTLQRVNSVVIQPDGKILAAGFLIVEAGNDFVVARYLPNGGFDTGFGDMGVVHTNFSTSAVNDLAFSMALQSDGKIVVVGVTENVVKRIALVRYTTDGNLDPAFGSGGKVIATPNPGNHYTMHSVMVQNDGRIIVSGYVSAGGPSSSYDMFFARYYSSGKIDKGFGNNGFVILPFGKRNPPHVGPNRDIVYSSAMYYASNEEPGRIVAVGSTGQGNHMDFGIARLNWLGGLDTTFGLPPQTPNND